jgi:general secretion pathway protein M
VALTLPTGQRGQVMALALAMLTAVIAWVGVIGPALDFYAVRQDQVDTLRAKAARNAALIEALPRLTKSAELASHTPTRAVLQGDSDAIAGAALQEQVQTMASGANAQLTSIETLPGEQVGAYRRIGVRVELSALLPVTIHLLAAIEEAQPSMLLDDIRLTATPVGPQNAQLPLDAAFTVYAFRVGTAKEDQP